MQPVLLWPRPHSAIAEYLERSPDDFTVVDTDHFHELQKLYKLRRDIPIFDPFPSHGQYYRDFANHIAASGCRYHIIGLEACQGVLRTLKDPSLSRATTEEILLDGAVSLEEIKTEGGHLAADNFSYKTDRALPYSCLRIHAHTQADHG